MEYLDYYSVPRIQDKDKDGFLPAQNQLVLYSCDADDSLPKRAGLLSTCHEPEHLPWYRQGVIISCQEPVRIKPRLFNLLQGTALNLTGVLQFHILDLEKSQKDIRENPYVREHDAL